MTVAENLLYPMVLLCSISVCVLWYMNHSRLFNPKSCLYKYTKYDLETRFVDNIFKQGWVHIFTKS